MSFRSLISFCLVLVLALTSQAMAVARGASAATDQMVICTGMGIETVYLDVQGQPVEAPHFCPDCVLADLAVPMAGGSAASLNLALTQQVWRLDSQDAVATARPKPPSRAPPSLV